jgi:hypothetical protein
MEQQWQHRMAEPDGGDSDLFYGLLRGRGKVRRLANLGYRRATLCAVGEGCRCCFRRNSDARE